MSALATYQKLYKELKAGKLHTIYLLYGPEDGLIAQSVHLIREHALAGQAEELQNINYLQFEGKGLNMDSLEEAVVSSPMFAPSKVVYLSNAPMGSGAKGKSAVEDELDEPAEDTPPPNDVTERLVRVLEKCPSSTIFMLEATVAHKNRKAYKTITQRGAVYEFPPLSRDEAVTVVSSEAKRAGIALDSQATRLLFDLVGVDGRTPCLRSLKSEVQKLSAYKGFSGTITAEDVALLVERSAEAKIWDLTDAISVKDTRKVLSSVQQLWQDGNDPLRVLASLSRHFGSLLAARQALDSGLAAAQVEPLLGLAPYPASKCVKTARSFSVDQLKQGLLWCLELDSDIKTGKRNPRLGLEVLVSKFCT